MILVLISFSTSFGSYLSSTGSHELNVAHLEDCRKQLEHVPDLLLIEFHHFQSFLQHKVTQMCHNKES